MSLSLSKDISTISLVDSDASTVKPDDERPIPSYDGSLESEHHSINLSTFLADPSRTITENQAYEGFGIQDWFSPPHTAKYAVTVALSGLIIGLHRAILMAMFLRIHSGEQASAFLLFIGSVIPIGAVVGVFILTWIVDFIPRQFSILPGGVLFFFAAIAALARTSKESLPQFLLVAYFMGSVGVGMLSMIAPIYIAEISPPKIRGRLLVLEEIAILAGTLLGIWVSLGTSYIGEDDWAFAFMIQCLLIILLTSNITQLPSSPRYQVHSLPEARIIHLINLAELRSLPSDNKRLQCEFEDIQAEMSSYQQRFEGKYPNSQEKAGFVYYIRFQALALRDCFGEYIMRTHIGVVLMCLQQLVGAHTLIYSSTTMFEHLRLAQYMNLIMPGILITCQLLGTISSLWTIDRYGRKPLLVGGSIVMFICQTLLAVVIGIKQSNWALYRELRWFCVGLQLLYCISLGASWGPVAWVMPSEIFPTYLRPKGITLSTLSYWLSNLAVALIVPKLIQKTLLGTIALSAIISLVAGVWATFCVPETNNKTLEEMGGIEGLFEGTSNIVPVEDMEDQLELGALIGNSEELQDEGV